MKKLSKFIAAAIAFAFLISSFSAFAQTSKSPFISKTYTHNAQFNNCTVLDGIDVSYHNQSEACPVNWKNIKNSGVDYVIIRAGYRGYSQKGTLVKDSCFDSYIKGAAAQGLKIGIYFYSQAVNESEAKEEANKTLEIIKSYKSYINLPVYYDYEFAEVSTGRLDSAYQTWYKNGTHKKIMTANAKAFCDTIVKAGYEAGIYGNLDFFTTKYNTSELEKYNIWLAHYISSSAVKTSYSGKYHMWQYSSSGKLSKVSYKNSSGTTVYPVFDVNFLYVPKSGSKPVIKAIANQVYTGSEIKPALTVTKGNKQLIKGEDYYINSYSNNVNIGTATVQITFVNDYESYGTATASFRIVPSKVLNPKITAFTSSSITLKWDKHSDADGYQILTKANGGSWQTVATTKELSYKITDLTSASDYLVTVRAYKTISGINYYGQYADNQESITKPAKVKGLSISKKTDSSLTLSWKAQKYATRYEIYQYNDKTKEYEIIKKLNDAGKSSYKVSNLQSNKLYYFKIRAVKEDKSGKVYNGAQSEKVYEYTTVKTPVPKSAVSNKSKKITYKFSKVSAASGYQIQWSTSSTFSSNTKKEFVKKSATSKTITTAKSKKKYYVRIRSYKTRDGKKIYSPWSSKLSVKTK